ncbi:MAG: ECF-type sigma factor [Pseudomonadota bacterium]
MSINAETAGAITDALRGLGGAPVDVDRVLSLSYGDLLRVVRNEKRRLAGASAGADTEVVLHDALGRLLGSDRFRFDNRRHLFRTVARIARHLVIDHARAANALKRGGGLVAVPLEEDVVADESSPARAEQLETAVYVDQLLARISAESPEIAEVLELRFFLDLTEAETAEVLGVSLRTVQRRWREGRKGLAALIEGQGATD